MPPIREARQTGAGQMAIQIGLGTALILLSIVVGATAFWLIELLFDRASRSRRGHPRGRLLVFSMAAMIVAVAQMTLAVWLWALTFWGIGAFPDPETSVYFALVAFTTLGFGDLLLPLEWRLLGGFAAANGLLNFGLMTAFLVEVLRAFRIDQKLSRGR